VKRRPVVGTFGWRCPRCKHLIRIPAVKPKEGSTLRCRKCGRPVLIVDDIFPRPIREPDNRKYDAMVVRDMMRKGR